MPHITNFGDFLSPGPFGAAAAPFAPGGGGEMQRDLKLALPLERLDDRRQLLTRLDQIKAGLDDAQRSGVDSTRERALRVLLGTVAEAFDLSREPSRLVARYDTAPLVRPENINTKWNNRKHY